MVRLRSWYQLTAVAMMVGCGSKPNPAATCMKGTCVDPSYPYCDLDGSVSGTPGACIAVTCTAGKFNKCNADTALTCNQFGTGYEQVACAHGCDDSSGCKLCEANQTSCSNGAVTSCDANGNETTVIRCPLGCFEDQPRCRDISPSNRLGQYFDNATEFTDLNIPNGAYVNTNNGMINNAETAPSQLVLSPDGGPAMRVFVVNKLTFSDVTFFGDAAIVFLANSDVSINGHIIPSAGAGSSNELACRGKAGNIFNLRDGSVGASSPGGGGGATAGAPGGVVFNPDGYSASEGGEKFGTDDLQPLIGGCLGGGFVGDNSDDSYAIGAPGGGAIQISSRTSIMVNGSIRADGLSGGVDGQLGGTSVYGASGAGAVLLEAPKVTLEANALIGAVGGNGFGCDPARADCGAMGRGGDGVHAAGAGDNVSWSYNHCQNPPCNVWLSGGGGGGAGRVRVNTPTGGYTADSSAVVQAVSTTGVLKTR